MNAMKAQNRAPGFVPLGLRPIGVQARALAAPTPHFRPTPYRPPMLVNSVDTVELGQQLDPEQVPRSISLGVLGAGALIVSTLTPSPINVISMAAGFGLLGYGLYSAFSKSSPPEKEVSRLPLPEDQTVQNTRVLASFNYPPREGLVPIALNGSYRIAFMVQNKSDRPVDVLATVRVEEFTRGFMGMDWTSERGVQEKHYEVRGIAPGASKGYNDPQFPAYFKQLRHDAVATLYVRVANDDPGSVYASLPFSLEGVAPGMIG